MGYSTTFIGEFKVNKPLDTETNELLNGISTTRRMKRCLSTIASKMQITLNEAITKYGLEGELYFDKNDLKEFGQMPEKSILDYNMPPKSQPGLWCQWVYDPKTISIKWDDVEKFYNYTHWIKYLIKRILDPKGYKLNGTVKWQGQNVSDVGTICIKDNEVSITPVNHYFNDTFHLIN
jgi:hypothetical protein